MHLAGLGITVNFILKKALCHLLPSQLPMELVRENKVIPINYSANASSKVVVSPSKIQHLPSSASKVCSLPPTPCTELIIPLQSHNKLKSLTLQGPLDEPRIGLEERASLAQWLSSPSCSLKELELGNNDLTFDVNTQIVTALQ